MFFIQENNRLLIDYTTSRLLAFAYNAKSFEIFIIFILIFFSTANLADLTKIHVEFFTFLKLDECPLIRTHYTIHPV